MTDKSRIEIEYCTQCRWMLRAAWVAQELLTTFQDDVGEVALIPGTGRRIPRARERRNGVVSQR